MLKKSKKKKPSKSKKKFPGILFRLLVPTVLVFCMLMGVYVFSLSMLAREKFGEKKWDLPARIYARPLELYPGMKIDEKDFKEELLLMKYRYVDRIDGAGSFSRLNNTFTLFTRDFKMGDEHIPSRKIRITVNNKTIAALEDLETAGPLALVRLDPAHIGSFYPIHNQDRLWVKMEDVSPLLLQTILAVEDRDFYDHYGVKPLSIVRAMIANIKEGRAVQGGSTLTQQLIKNLFLTSEQSLKRKFDEAIMAISLELSYEKDQILEAYINEVYMGQDGKRAIHGFGMAARFYFGREIEDLCPGETALLVGLLKGPSYYEPRRFSQRARHRRNMVLKIMADQKLIHGDVAENIMKSPLTVTARSSGGGTRFPSFLDLVKRRLLEEYPEEELHCEGLKILTSFDPQIQFALEKAVISQLDDIEKLYGMPAGKLEAAAVVTSTASNEVLAFIGGRKPGNEGFNRGLDARRSIGSLVKPAVYLTALQFPEKYTLITPLEDSEIRIKIKKDQYWSPRNYDRQYHGNIPLFEALAHSYNAATVRLGMNLNLENVFETIRKLGVNRRFEPFPSALLGTMSMTVMEVAQMNQTLAAGGFYSPVRAIRAVYKVDETPLQRYTLTVRQNIDPGAVYLLNKALQAAVLEGTAAPLKAVLPDSMGIAGKTGTTDDLRDSWFAGFTGNHLAVVWVGRDDYKPCALTGATGALQVWGRFIGSISTLPLVLIQPENVEWVVVAPASGFSTDEWCPGALSIPFIKGSEPLQKISCGKEPKRRIESFSPDKPSFLDHIKGLF